MADELVLYTNPMSRGRIARWMLEEVGQPYKTDVLNYASTMKAPAYLAINPMGKVPALRHGDAVVTETAAICAYLAENRATIDHAQFYLALPLGLTVFALWFTWWCDAEVKRQFGQIVTAEIGMGFYDIDVEGEPVLPAMYKNSPVVTRPIVWAGYVAQTVSLLVIGIVAVLLG